ncbi:calcium-binding protein [Phyllobacterium phragmitis]|uniref:Calcium-binding protein n=1 Tax=Phyllobacterium phragmitis TaxID=2670329 RepID=A0A2S9IPH9_9HYPH|nr:calcium-binding protein [Phyllobacterium phragmitis]PRD42429.1 calcium-binding protein [Phyllobacterium phragmitis]
MKAIPVYIALLTSVVLASPTFAQEDSETDAGSAQVESSDSAHERFKNEPVDLAKFAKTDELKAADTNGDGTLSHDELEAMAMKRIASRAADRMQRRLDINGDGKVTLEEIEKQRGKEFAALDRNEDGKLDRKELRAGKRFHRHGGHHGGHHMKKRMHQAQ